jgi:metal-sulfur cluster biosynthetic enzyme
MVSSPSGSRPGEASGHDPRHDEQIRAALGRVYDPCSLAVNNPLSLIEMGLVRDWHLDAGGALRVRMCVTSPNCMMAPKFLEASRLELSKIEGLASVHVEVDPTVFWTPELMTDEGRRSTRLRRARSRRAAPVRPQQWRTHDDVASGVEPPVGVSSGRPIAVDGGNTAQ